MKESTIRKIISEVFSFSFPFSATIPYLVAIFLYNYHFLLIPFLSDTQNHQVRFCEIRYFVWISSNIWTKDPMEKGLCKTDWKKLQWLNLDDSEKIIKS